MTRGTVHHPAIAAVAALIRARPDVVDTDDGPIRIQQPCLLQMLIIYLHSSSSGTGGGGRGAGTIPLNTQAWDLLVEVRVATHTWAHLLAINAARYATREVPRAGKPTTPPVGKLLRAVAVEAVSSGRKPVADAVARCARRWAGRIEAMLAEQPEQRDVRGARCPECLARSVSELREDPGNRRREDGMGQFATPAIALVLPQDVDGRPVVYCRACGWWETLAELAEAAPCM